MTNQTVDLTAVAGTQTFTLVGTLGLDGTTLAGTYSSTPGTAPDGSPCGTAQTDLQWSAALVPPITGEIQGIFHSLGGAAGLNEQDFSVVGTLTQATNTGASSALITGNLSVTNYPCLANVSVYGQISGTAIALEIFGAGQTQWGLIGEPFGSFGGTGINPVTLVSSQSGYILLGIGPSYLVATTPCPGNLENVTQAGDFGSICLRLNAANFSSCQQPLTFTPSILVFPSQFENSPPTVQTVVLANASSATLSSLTLNLVNNNGANFTETDACGVNGVPSQGQPFALAPGQSCQVTVTFAPQAACSNGQSQCLTATLTLNSPNNSTIIVLQISGTAVSGQTAEGLQPRFDLDVGLGSAHSLSALAKWFHLGRLVADKGSSVDVNHDAETD